MAKKPTGISRELLIHPGETLAEVLEGHGLTQAELAASINVSPDYIQCVISGEENITAEFAAKLESAFGVPGDFWMKLQANYDEELLEVQEKEEEEKARKSLGVVIPYLKKEGLISDKKKKEVVVSDLQKLFRVNSIVAIKDFAPSGAFRMATNSSVDPYVMGAWLRLCQICTESQVVHTRFNPASINDLIHEIKSVMLKEDRNVTNVIDELTSVMSRYGIMFSVIPNFRGAPVHGYISGRDNDVYQMVLTIRGAYADIFWFSLFHELGHIMNRDVPETSFIDKDYENEEQEHAANCFAEEALLEKNSYEAFLSKKDYSIGAIRKYAATQRVMPYIVIGRLQREERIPYAWYKEYKVRYKWPWQHQKCKNIREK